MAKVFLKRGNIYTLTEGNFDVMDSLDEGIYQTHQNPVNGEIFLEKIGERFNFGFKLYGVDETLVNHVLNTYNKQETKKNIGVLLNGAKGTGKTVTAKLLANKLGLPVILCDQPYTGLEFFLASIDHDCVFLFDEFEKNFRMDCGGDENCAGENLLSIMDGVYNTEHCHVFILTTNELNVNDNLLCRPSRIRYLKSFGDVIDHKVLESYVKDNLKNQEYFDEVMEFVDTLEIATIDIVKSIVEEINLHDVHIEEFKRFFNVKEAEYNYYTRTWQYDLGSEDVMDRKEFIKICKMPYSSPDIDYNRRPPYGTFKTHKPFPKMKEGEILRGTSWKVKEIDIAAGYMLCVDANRPYRFKHFYVENPDAKPSIYSAERQAYGYGDYYDY